MRRPVGKERCGVPGCSRLEKKLGKLVLIRDQDTNLEEFLFNTTHMFQFDQLLQFWA